MQNETWRPGSFTKNFSWGDVNSGRGLEQLYDEIKVGFDLKAHDVERKVFRNRVSTFGRPDYIPLNFFLFNRIIEGLDFVICDELVYQAVSFPHSKDFDLLALFAFNLSMVGTWKGASPSQSRPALWANAYIRERVAGYFDWDVAKVNADDIENFVSKDPRYQAKTTRKLATNLNHQYLVGGLSGFATSRIERWWVNALFLALDRIIEDRKNKNIDTPESKYSSLLSEYGFIELTGKRTLEKELAMRHLVSLYSACGGCERFSERLTNVRVRDIEEYVTLPNDNRPGGAIHPTNPKILKTIPRACAQLVVNAGFDFLYPEELEDFDVEEFVKRKTTEALKRLRGMDIKPTMTADELLKITRGV